MAYRTPRNRGGLPGLLVFVLGAALIFGGFYIWQGAANFIRTGGMGVVEATEQARVVASATAIRVTRLATQGAVSLITLLMKFAGGGAEGAAPADGTATP